MAKKSITKRWLVNNLGIIFMIMLVIEVIFIYVIQNYYYSSARQYLTSKLNSVTSVLSLYSEDSTVNFSSELC
ncbi:MAG: sensor histidine kinase, partial [Oscillospiraceae bacterium]|nr:sensor histidine kinase [Oscillospiraceae bacterium]